MPQQPRPNNTYVTSVLQDPGLSPRARLLYALLYYKPATTITTMSVQLGCSKRTTSRTLQELVDDGLLTITYSTRAGQPNTYTLRTP